MKSELHPVDQLIVTKLALQGRKTKLQLMSMGFTKYMIEKLVDLEILVSIQDPITQLRYYKVSDSYAF